MKKTLFTFFILSGFAASAQTLQASLSKGSQPNSIKIFVKSSEAIGTTNISTLQFNVGIKNDIVGKPTITVIPNTTNFPGVTWQVNEADEGGYNNFKITTPTAPIQVTSLNTTAEVEVMEVVFDGGTTDPQAVSLVSLPGGGSTADLLFLSTGVPESIGTNLYYQRDGVAIKLGNSYEGTDLAADISTATITGIPLPVNFLSFYALKSGEAAKLTWTVENDHDNAYFEIERSADGRNYTTIGRVNAFNNGKSVNVYESNDAALTSLSTKVASYRIKQVDKNGTVSYSLIRNLNIDKKALALSLFPNPARSSSKLVFDASAAGKATISIRDVSGKQVQMTNIQLVKGVNQHTLNLQMLPAGDYNVTLIGSGLSETVKLSRVN